MALTDESATSFRDRLNEAESFAIALVGGYQLSTRLPMSLGVDTAAYPEAIVGQILTADSLRQQGLHCAGFGGPPLPPVESENRLS